MGNPLGPEWAPLGRLFRGACPRPLVGEDHKLGEMDAESDAL
jgi:hypothetical protein